MVVQSFVYDVVRRCTMLYDVVRMYECTILFLEVDKANVGIVSKVCC